VSEPFDVARSKPPAVTMPPVPYADPCAETFSGTLQQVAVTPPPVCPSRTTREDVRRGVRPRTSNALTRRPGRPPAESAYRTAPPAPTLRAGAAARWKGRGWAVQGGNPRSGRRRRPRPVGSSAVRPGQATVATSPQQRTLLVPAGGPPCAAQIRAVSGVRRSRLAATPGRAATPSGARPLATTTLLLP
jgi:hypothetical protein